MLHLITAIVKPHRLEEVKDSLREAGVTGLTVTEVRGYGRQGGHDETYRGSEYHIDFLPKVKVEVLIATEDVDRVTKVLADAARTGQIGDGKVWVVAVDRAMRIRTGEMDVDAV
jgi:nitrogen regulatory protein P-II 1